MKVVDCKHALVIEHIVDSWNRCISIMGF